MGHISVYVHYSYKIFNFAKEYKRAIHNSLLSISLNKSINMYRNSAREERIFLTYFKQSIIFPRVIFGGTENSLSDCLKNSIIYEI